MKRIVLRLVELVWSLLPNRIKVQCIEYSGNIGFLDTTRARIKMKVESMDSYKRLNSCRKEPSTIEWIDESVHPGEVFYDIGANVGAYSLYAAAVKGARVYSFEPSPSTFQLLMENIHINALSEMIVPFNIPLSSSSALKEFRYKNLRPGAASHTGLEEETKNNKSIVQPVLTITLDELTRLHSFPKPNHIKIDVDGHELSILKGARQVLLGEQLKNIQIELSVEDKNYKEITGLMAEAGYRIKKTSSHANASVTDVVFSK